MPRRVKDRAPEQPRTSTPSRRSPHTQRARRSAQEHAVKSLQRSIGNRATAALLRNLSPTHQPRAANDQPTPAGKITLRRAFARPSAAVRSESGQRSSQSRQPVVQRVEVEVTPVNAGEASRPVGATTGFDPRKAKPHVVTRLVGPSPPSIAQLDPSTWGFTEDEVVEPTIKVSRDRTNNVWKTSLPKIEGHYSLQTQLLPGVQEVDPAGGGNTDANNWEEQVLELDALGDHPGPSHWYMIKAVEEHEKVHANTLKDALSDVAELIERRYQSLTLPLASQPNPVAALNAVQALPAYGNAANYARGLWDAKYLEYIDKDHVTKTQTAEHKIVDPMIKRIRAIAKGRGW